MKKNKRKDNVETFAESFYQFFRYLLDLCVCGYMLLIIVVMPFYNEEGYNHIGTDKSTFFRNCIIYGSRLILPVLALTVILSLIIYLQNKGLPDWKQIRFKDVIANCKKNISITDCFALAYGLSVMISYLFSHYKEEALWGTQGWYMGMIPQVTSVVVYFLVSRAWKGRKWMIAVVFAVSAVVFGLGFLNRFGIYPIDMKIQLSTFISTIGNINWYCGYLVSVFFVGITFFWKKNWKDVRLKILMVGYLVIGFATLVTQGSNSGILTMTVIILLLFWLSASDEKRMETFWFEMVLFSATCLVIYLLRLTKLMNCTYADTIVNLFTFSPLPIVMTVVSLVFWLWLRSSNRKGRYPQKAFKWLTRIACGGTLALLGLYIILMVINTVSGGIITNMTTPSLQNLLTFSEKWGSNRGATWICGWLCFVQQDFLHMLTGAGPDCMAAFLYNDGSAELLAKVQQNFGTARLTNAHNEWLTILVNVGLLGLVSYVGMMISAIKRMIQNRNVSVIAVSCGMGILAYTINNVFSFQQSMSLATIFVILGMGENFMRGDAE